MIQFPARDELLFSPKCSDHFWGACSLLFNGYRGFKQPGREAVHSSPSSDEIGSEWSYASTVLMPSWCGV
jgi:hypothetical protein